MPFPPGSVRRLRSVSFCTGFDAESPKILISTILPALIRRPLPCRCFVCRLSGCHSAASLFSAGACQAVTRLPLCRQSAGFPLPRCRRRAAGSRRRPILCLSYHAPRRPVKPPLAFRRRRFPSREKPGAPSAGAYRKRSCGAFLATGPREANTSAQRDVRARPAGDGAAKNPGLSTGTFLVRHRGLEPRTH